MPMVGTLSGNQSSQSFASPLPNSCSHGHWHRVSVGSETGNQRRTLQLRRGNVAAFKINSATHSLLVLRARGMPGEGQSLERAFKKARGHEFQLSGYCMP